MMSQGQFTKEEAEETKKSINEMFDAIPKSRRMGYIGHLNDVLLFIEAAQRVAPSEKDSAHHESVDSVQLASIRDLPQSDR